MDNKDDKTTIESITIKDVSKSIDDEDVSKSIDEYCKLMDMIKKEMFDSLAIPKDKFKFDYTTSLGHPHYYFDRQYNFCSGLLIEEPEKPVVPEKVLDKALADSENPALTLDLPAYCRPVAGEGTYNLTLTTTYDVYDLKGQNLGERVSENKIKFDVAEVKPGQEKKLVLTVKPTYLYVLSDNDADNPTITLGE